VTALAQPTDVEMEEYRQGLARRENAERESLRLRRRRAWSAARRAASLLKRTFGARRTWVFGSLAHRARYHAASDIDLAVEGLQPGAVWRAWAAVDKSAPGFQVDLVEIETALPALRKSILVQGKEL
jgi:predicted nucleotidyltransferase